MGSVPVVRKTLIELASAYIEDGKLKKYSFYDENPESMHYKLHTKYENGETLTPEEMDYLMSNINDLLIKSGNNVSVIKPTDGLIREYKEIIEQIDKELSEVAVGHEWYFQLKKLERLRQNKL